MALERYLIDTSALVRVGHPAVASVWAATLQAGLVHICPATEAEFLYSARSLDDYEQNRDDLADICPWTPMPEDVWDRVREVQYDLARTGCLRSAGLADLLVAATAELAKLTVLHYDGDFDAIAKITGQPTRWIAPAGSLGESAEPRPPV
ncbi:PIN domain nuclease [Nocardia sp. NPDC052566]|uniref:PIN domain nuclease n=1 Tax=Nocardia sp. NPDC052566 TaxID=3364330 RepID=UPI0037C95933